MEARKIAPTSIANIGTTEQPPSDMYGTVQSRGSIDFMPDRPMLNPNPLGKPSAKQLFSSSLDSFRYNRMGVSQPEVVGEPVSLEQPIRSNMPPIQTPIMPVCPPCPKCGCQVIEGFYGGSCCCGRDNNLLFFLIILVVFFYLMKK